MDILLRGKFFCFSIDEICYVRGTIFTARLIPDIQSNFFPSFHLRSIMFSAELLEEDFYQSVFAKIPDMPIIEKFYGSIAQGAYYEIPSKSFEAFELGKNEDYIFTVNNDIFAEAKVDSPYQDGTIRQEIVLDGIRGYAKLSNNSDDNRKCSYIYGLNVGQGESLLLLPSTGNPYLIDTNFYSNNDLTNKINLIQKILRSHKLPTNRIKALVVTHKHIDHIRGARQLIESKRFNIENFLINLDYHHNTSIVTELLTAALKIPNWINVNSTGYILEGKTRICIRNPEHDTCNKLGAPDINDSSISMCICFGNTYAYLTGDTGYNILLDKYSSIYRNQGKQFLKVSHHGSETGTDSNLINFLNPTHAFISAGHHKTYRHPRQSVINLLKAHHSVIDCYVTKWLKTNIQFKFTKRSIKVNCLR